LSSASSFSNRSQTSFEEKHGALAKDKTADPEERDEYTADNIFWVNKIARWSYLQGRANLNKAVAEFPEVAKMSVEDMLKNLDAVPEKIRTVVHNNGGGHYDHSLFWQMLKKDGGEPKGALAAAMDRRFGSFSGFKGEWTKAAVGQFGSGWGWLVVDANKQLAIEPSANQDSPVSHGKLPLLGIDVWEHAYYLKYQNRRPEYVAAFFDVINWDFVSQRYENATA